MLTQGGLVAHVSGNENRPSVLIATVDHGIQLLESPLVLRRDGEVLEELRKGYMIRERLLRPAMVKVAKA